MKTTAQVCAMLPSKLVRSTVRQIKDKTYFADVYAHGADGGFHGFIWYKDTVSFYRRNKKEIVELVERCADDAGEGPLEFVGNFNCLKNATTKEIAQTLYCNLPDDPSVPNALAWFALEEVARAFCEE